MELWIIRAIGIIAGIIMLKYYLRRQRRFLSFAVGSLSGLAALWAVCTWGGEIGLFIRADWLTILAAVILGVPGVILVSIVNLL